MLRRLARRPLVWAVGGAGAVAALWVAFGYFGVHTLVVDETVDEDRPVLASERPPAQGPAAEGPTDVPATTTVAEGTFVDRSHPTSGTALVLSNDEEQVLRLEGFRTDNGPDLNVYLSAAPVDAGAGEFDDDFVDLGDLKGNVGDQNYEIPAGVDLDRYPTVVVWCVRFGVAFGAASLA